MYVTSSEKRVLVFKAIGQKTLRIFPGPNSIPDGVDLEAYTNGNEAATALVKEHIKVVKSESLSQDEKKQAEIIKERNETLNRAQRIIEEQESALKDGSKENKLLTKALSSANEQLKELESKFEDMMLKVEETQKDVKEVKKSRKSKKQQEENKDK